MNLKSRLKKIKPLRTVYGVFYQSLFGILARVNPMWFFQLKWRLSPIGRWLNLKNPQTYSEKLVWLNFYWRHPLKSKCADKIAVRDYVRECGCEELLIPLVGVWDRVEDIDFDKLPNRFALKCNHGCGCNIICKDKSKLDIADAKRRLAAWMKRDYGTTEFHYSAIKPRIICEELLDDGKHIVPVDYKMNCFSGKFFMCSAMLDRIPGQIGARKICLDGDFKRMMIRRKEEPMNLMCEKPKDFDKMITYAEKLAKPFPFCRVDFYYVNGKIYLGELTFTSAGCLDASYTDEAQRQMGALIQLPDPIK